MGAVVNRESAPAAPPAMRRSIGGRLSVAAAAEAAEVEAIPLARPCAVRGLAVPAPLAEGASASLSFSREATPSGDRSPKRREKSRLADRKKKAGDETRPPGTRVDAVRPRVASRPPGSPEASSERDDTETSRISYIVY